MCVFLFFQVLRSKNQKTLRFLKVYCTRALPKTNNTRAFFEYLMFGLTTADVCAQEVLFKF